MSPPSVLISLTCRPLNTRLKFTHFSLVPCPIAILSTANARAQVRSLLFSGKSFVSRLSCANHLSLPLLCIAFIVFLSVCLRLPAYRFHFPLSLSPLLISILVCLFLYFFSSLGLSFCLFFFLPPSLPTFIFLSLSSFTPISSPFLEPQSPLANRHSLAPLIITLIALSHLV